MLARSGKYCIALAATLCALPGCLQFDCTAADITCKPGATLFLLNALDPLASASSGSQLPKLYIASNTTDSIIRIDDLTGAGLTTYQPGVGILDGPWGITQDGAGRIYIVSQNNNTLLRINDFSGAGLTTYTGAIEYSA